MKILLAVIMLVIASPSWGNPLVLLGVGFPTPPYTDEFWWNGDYNGGDDDTERSTAQITHRTTTSVGTPSAAGVFSSTQKHDGTYAFYRDNAADKLAFTQTDGEICNANTGYVSFRVRLTAAPTAALMEFFQLFEDSAHYIHGAVLTSGYPYLRVFDCAIQGSTLLSTDGSFDLIEMAWENSGSDYVKLRVNGGSWEQSGACTISAFASAGNDNFEIGGNSISGGIGSYYLDSFQMWTTSGGT